LRNHLVAQVAAFGRGSCLALLMTASLAVLGCKKAEPPVTAAGPVATRPTPPAPAAEPKEAGKLITIFCGAAGRPPIEEVADAFEKQHGCVVARAYGGSGTVLSQMIIGETGDVYIPGSDDFMDIAEGKGVLVPGSRKIVCYLVPGICVQKGNPKDIRTLDDLTKPGIKVGIGNPKAVCLGDIALKIFNEAGIADKVEPNILTHADSCGQVATLLKLKKVDAVIGWDVFTSWAPDQIDFIPVPEKLAHRRNIPAAVAKFTKNQALAQEFVDFIADSEESHAIFRRHGYTVEKPEQASEAARRGGTG
jgi:molybdate transport system substrate-binding protein